MSDQFVDEYRRLSGVKALHEDWTPTSPDELMMLLSEAESAIKDAGYEVEGINDLPDYIDALEAIIEDDAFPEELHERFGKLVGKLKRKGAGLFKRAVKGAKKVAKKADQGLRPGAYITVRPKKGKPYKRRVGKKGSGSPAASAAKMLFKPKKR